MEGIASHSEAFKRSLLGEENVGFLTPQKSYHIPIPFKAEPESTALYWLSETPSYHLSGDLNNEVLVH